MINSIQKNQFYAINSINNNDSRPKQQKQQNFAVKNQLAPSFQGKSSNIAMSLLTVLNFGIAHAEQAVAPQKAMVEEIGQKIMGKLSETPNPFKSLTGSVLREAEHPSNDVVIASVIGTCESITKSATTMKKKFVPEVTQTKVVEFNAEECGGRFTLGAKKLTSQEVKELQAGKALEEIQSPDGTYGFFMEGQIPKSGNPEEIKKFTDDVSALMKEQCK